MDKPQGERRQTAGLHRVEVALIFGEDFPIPPLPAFSRPMFFVVRFLVDRFARGDRRGAAACALVVYLATMFGYPVLEGPLKSGAGQPFPCQQHRCGCRTADQCWRSCCCYSPREKLAWAKSRGITPPMVLAAKTADDAPAPRTSRSPSCCSHREKAAGTEASEKSRFVWVPAIAAQKCRGLATSWLANGDPITPPPASVAVVIAPQCVAIATLPSPRFTSPSYSPPVPPG